MGFPDDNDTHPTGPAATIVEKSPLGSQQSDDKQSIGPSTDPLSETLGKDITADSEEVAGGMNEENTLLLDSPLDSGVRATLIVIQGPDAGAEHELKADTVTVGRSLSSDIVINDPSASRQHFRLDAAGGTYHLTDLSSGNGTEVDGAPTRDTDLLHNACIKSGTTLFRYILPGGPPAQDDPPKPIIKPRDEYVTPASVFPQQETPTPRRRRKSRKKGVIAPILSVLFLCLAGLAIWYVGEAEMGWWNITGHFQTSSTATGDTSSSDIPGESKSPPDKGAESGGGSETDTEPKGTESPSKSEALMESGIEDFRKGNWDAALVSFEAASKLTPAPKNLEPYLRRVQEEQTFQQLFHKAEGRLKARQHKAALDILRTIPKSAVVYPDAQFLMAPVRAAYLRERLDAARQAVLKRDRKLARACLDALFLEDSVYPDAIALRNALDRGLSRAVAHVGSELPEKESRTSKEPKEEEREEVKDKPKEGLVVENPEILVIPEVVVTQNKLDTGKTLRLYNGGDMSGALEAIQIELDKDLDAGENRKARKFMQAIRQFKDNYTKGKDARKAAMATRPLEKAYKADLILGGYYSHELKALLADRYAKRAAAGYAKEAYSRAAVFSRISLKYDAENINARGVADKCIEKAWIMNGEADAAYANGDAKRALQLYKTVLEIDPSNTNAMARFNELSQ